MNAKRGQPPKGGDALSVKVMLRLRPADKAELKRVSASYKGGMAALARKFVLEGIKRLRKRK